MIKLIQEEGFLDLYRVKPVTKPSLSKALAKGRIEVRIADPDKECLMDAWRCKEGEDVLATIKERGWDKPAVARVTHPSGKCNYNYVVFDVVGAHKSWNMKLRAARKAAQKARLKASKSK
jgi:hypothetical protein